MNLLYCFEGFPYPSRGGISQVSIRQSYYFRTHYQMECHCLCMRIENECEETSTFNGHIIVDYGKESTERIADYIGEHNIEVVIYQMVWNFKERAVKLLLPLYLRYFYCRDRCQKLYMYNHSARFVSLTEAQQNGVVPIAFDAFAALRYIVDDGINGVIVDNNKEQQYANKLFDLMNNNEKRKQMALQAVESSKRYVINTICNQWLALFKTVCNE